MPGNMRERIALGGWLTTVLLTWYLMPWSQLWLWLLFLALPAAMLYGSHRRKRRLIERRKQDTAGATGFCPRCDHPTGPGPCSKCGLELLPRQIRSTPRGPLRQHKGKLIVATTLLVFSLGGHYGYRTLDWPAWFSNQRLLRFMEHGNFKAAIELDRRLRNAELSGDERKRLFDHALRARLWMRSPYPVKVNLGPHLQVDSLVPSLMDQNTFFLRDYRVFLDDRDEPFHEKKGPWRSSRKRAGDWRLWVPKLDPGTHAIRVTGNITISASDNKGDMEDKAVFTSAFSENMSVNIIEKPAAGFVEAVNNANITNKMESSVYVYTDTRKVYDKEKDEWSPRPRLIIQTRASPIYIAATVEVSQTGAGEYRRVGVCHLRGYSSGVLFLDKVPGLEGATALDVRIKADPAEAVFGCPPESNRYYGGDIERSRVMLSRSTRRALSFKGDRD